VVSEQLRQQQELQRKLAKLAKQMDHLERARREEEAPLLAAAHDRKLKVGRSRSALPPRAGPRCTLASAQA
jgi:translation initiation factor 3 subunit A